MTILSKSMPFVLLRRAFLCFLVITIAFTVSWLPNISHAQSPPAVPDDNTLARLVWATMVSLDNANRTEDYSVLYNLGSPAFQTRNTPDTLAVAFQDLRNNRVDVGRAIMITPEYYLSPNVDQNGRLRLRGAFEYRPNSIRFDLLYESVDGGWAINAISVVEMDYNTPRE